jgi:hypothetical protein
MSLSDSDQDEWRENCLRCWFAIVHGGEDLFDRHSKLAGAVGESAVHILLGHAVAGDVRVLVCW